MLCASKPAFAYLQARAPRATALPAYLLTYLIFSEGLIATITFAATRTWPPVLPWLSARAGALPAAQGPLFLTRHSQQKKKTKIREENTRRPNHNREGEGGGRCSRVMPLRPALTGGCRAHFRRSQPRVLLPATLAPPRATLLFARSRCCYPRWRCFLLGSSGAGGRERGGEAALLPAPSWMRPPPAASGVPLGRSGFLFFFYAPVSRVCVASVGCSPTGWTTIAPVFSSPASVR